MGETEDERDRGVTKDRLAAQVESAVAALPAEVVGGLVVAYEPLWAIGPGQAATPDDAQDACRWIREVVGRATGPEVAESLRIQYGGSVTEENTAGFLACPDVDGALVGGASLDAAAFVGIIRAAAQAVR